MRDDPKPALQLVEPGGVGGGVVDVEIIRNVLLDQAQESQEFLMTMARPALGEHLAGGDV